MNIFKSIYIKFVIKIRPTSPDMYLKLILGEQLFWFTWISKSRLYSSEKLNKNSRKPKKFNEKRRILKRPPILIKNFKKMSYEEFVKWYKTYFEITQAATKIAKKKLRNKIYLFIRVRYNLYFRNFTRKYWSWVGYHNFNYYYYLKNFKWNEDLRFFLKKTFGHGTYQIYGYIAVMWFDILLTDDEPLLEPIEWSMVQTWILFIFAFAWIGENLIVSRYGSFTGKDKRVWAGWYRSFWIIDLWYALNYGITVLVSVVPYYHELTYSLPLVHSWWHWYTRVFFFKFIAFMTLILALGYWIQINYRWLHWKKIFIPIVIINILWSYLLFTQSIIFIFGYFTDPFWYQKSYYLNYTRIGMGPWKWQLTLSTKREPILAHPVKTTFWFKNDGPFASSALLFHMLILLTMFFVYIYWVALMRRVWSTKEIPLTYTTYCVNTIKHFLYGFFYFYVMVMCSFFVNYLRLPAEFLFNLDSMSWLENFVLILRDYPNFLIFIIFN
uniref:Uncharacterized protein n=1 Tax=Strombidium sp. TaxID=181122 RepID=A0A7T0M4J2_9SPIT|nr:hypothetical protein [Strombidium sp.]